jgi:hypothetical protein
MAEVLDGQAAAAAAAMVEGYAVSDVQGFVGVPVVVGVLEVVDVHAQAHAAVMAKAEGYVEGEALPEWQKCLTM